MESFGEVLRYILPINHVAKVFFRGQKYEGDFRTPWPPAHVPHAGLRPDARQTAKPLSSSQWLLFARTHTRALLSCEQITTLHGASGEVAEHRSSVLPPKALLRICLNIPNQPCLYFLGALTGEQAEKDHAVPTEPRTAAELVSACRSTLVG